MRKKVAPQSLRLALVDLASFRDQCIADEYTDTGELWALVDRVLEAAGVPHPILDVEMGERRQPK